jgi:hypothetical protein
MESMIGKVNMHGMIGTIVGMHGMMLMIGIVWWDK